MNTSCPSVTMPMPMQMSQMHMGMNNNCEMNQMMNPNVNYPMKWEPCTPPDEKPPASMLFPPLSRIFNQSRHSSTGEDYHGSSSGSPSSSLSSPNEFKDEPLGLDVHFGSSLFNAPFSPSATSSHSPSYGMMNGGHSMAPQQHSPLPSVAHFSHNHHLHHHVVQHHSQPTLQMSMNQIFTSQNHQYVTNVPHNFLFKDSTIYEGMGGMGLAAAQQQLKARNKMHEMALRQHLITDQNLSSNGELVLSAEERRTLVQEGYPIPQKYPLSKGEEEALKIVRRKIKNKLSAQESRRKRKEYIDALESRLHCFSEENKTLKQQVHQLEASNRDLQQKLHQYESKDKM